MDRAVLAGLKTERRTHLRRAKEIERAIVLLGGKTGKARKVRRKMGPRRKKAKAAKAAESTKPTPGIRAAGNGKGSSKTVGKIVKDANIRVE